MFWSKSQSILFHPRCRSLSLEQSTIFFSVSMVIYLGTCFFKDTVENTIIIFLQFTFCALIMSLVIILTVFCYVHQYFWSKIILRLFYNGHLLSAQYLRAHLRLAIQCFGQLKLDRNVDHCMRFTTKWHRGGCWPWSCCPTKIHHLGHQAKIGIRTHSFASEFSYLSVVSFSTSCTMYDAPTDFLTYENSSFIIALTLSRKL